MKKISLFILLVLSFVAYNQEDSIVKVKMVNEEKGFAFHYNEGLKKLQSNDLEGALASFNASIQLKSDEERTNFQKGVVLYSLGDFQNSRVSILKSIQISPSSDAYYYLGLLDEKSTKQEDAVRSYSESLKLDSTNYLSRYSLGVIYFTKGMYSEARTTFQTVLKVKPDFSYAWNDLGSTKLMEKDYKGAIEAYSKALEITPDFAICFNNLGSAYRKLEDYKSAIRSYSKAISLKNDYFIALNNRGSVKIEDGDFTGAVQDFSEAIKFNANYAAAYSNRAGAKNKLKDYQGGIEDCNKAISIDPSFGVAYLNRGILKESLLDLKGACVDWKKANELGVKQAVTYIEYCH